MPKTFRESEVLSRYVHDLVRRRALKAISAHDSKLSKVFDRIAAGVRRDLRASGYTVAQVREVIEKHFAAESETRLAIIEESIRDAAREARSLDRETFNAVFGAEEAAKAAIPLVPTFRTDADALSVASARIRGRTSIDRLSVSRRLHAQDARIKADMRQVIQSSVRAGEQITRTAERLLDADTPKVNVPKYVLELREAASTGSGKAYAGAVKAWSRQVEGLGQGALGEAGEYTLRSASRQLVRDLGKAKAGTVDKVVDRWILEKARYQARMMARHESVEAFRDVAIAQSKDQPWTVGVRWTLSPAHPRPDVCDVYASSDQYGLGPGGYPADSVPSRHPSCLCSMVSISDPHYMKRETAKIKGEPEPAKPWLSGVKQSPEDWLKAQDKDLRRAIIGPTRDRLLGNGRKLIDEGASNFRPVYRLLQKPRPTRDLGPSVDVTQIVRRDRENQVLPFPRLSI